MCKSRGAQNTTSKTDKNARRQSRRIKSELSKQLCRQKGLNKSQEIYSYLDHFWQPKSSAQTPGLIDEIGAFCPQIV